MLDSYNLPALSCNSELPNIYFNSIFQSKQSGRFLSKSTLPELNPRKMKQSLSPTIKGSSLKHKQKSPYKKIVRHSLTGRDKLLEERSKSQVSPSHSISISHGVKGKHISARSNSRVFGKTTEEITSISPGDTLRYDLTSETHKDEKKTNFNQLLDLKNLRLILRKTSKSRVKSNDFRHMQPTRNDVESIACEVKMNRHALNSYKGAGPLRMKQI